MSIKKSSKLIHDGREKLDLEGFIREAGEQLRSGKPLPGAEGIFTPLLKKILEASLEAELDEHLKQTPSTAKNRRIGHAQKNVHSSLGGFNIFSPHDLNAIFN